MPKHRGGQGRRDADQNASCGFNRTMATERLAALPAHFLRHWADRSIGLGQMQHSYNSLKTRGRTRFQVVDGKLYYPDLKLKTFGCVLRRTPILAWALLEMLDRHAVADVDIPFNCRDKPGNRVAKRLVDDGGTTSRRRSKSVTETPRLAFSYTTGAMYTDIPLPDYTYWVRPTPCSKAPRRAHAQAPECACSQPLFRHATRCCRRVCPTRRWYRGRPGSPPQSTASRARPAGRPRWLATQTEQAAAAAACGQRRAR